MSFSCLLIKFSFAVWKSLQFWNCHFCHLNSLLFWNCHFCHLNLCHFDILKEVDRNYSKCLPTKFATCWLFFWTYYESISIHISKKNLCYVEQLLDISKKVYVILCNIWICSKNAVILHVEITCKIGVCFLAWCLFWLTKFSIWQTSATS